MIIIKFQNGWGASYDAILEYKSTPIYGDNGKIASLKKTRYCKVNDLYIVEGDFEGDVQFAIKDSQTDTMVCYNGIVDGKSIRVTSECDNEFLLKIN